MMLQNLRRATREIHEKLEGQNLAKKIIDHSISKEEYILLLIQNYKAYLAAEAAIQRIYPNFEKIRTSKLEKDLYNLDVKISEIRPLDFQCEDTSEALGAQYVVEGSSMGGMLISKEMENCPALQSLPEQYFFSRNRDVIKSWNVFQKKFQKKDFSEEEIKSAQAKAIATFTLFERAFETEYSAG